jgi:hypothetical protein
MHHFARFLDSAAILLYLMSRNDDRREQPRNQHVARPQTIKLHTQCGNAIPVRFSFKTRRCLAPPASSDMQGPPENPVFNMSEKEVRLRLEKGLGHFFEKDRKLLESGIREDSLAHQLARHLAVEFAGFDVDAEYDKMHVGGIPHQKKYIGLDGKERGAIPDIIVHRRQHMDNFVAIEIKKAENKRDRLKDFEKLNAYRSQLQYRFAVFLEIGLKNDKLFSRIQFV